MSVRIVTDSASDIRPAEAARLGIDIVPLKTIFSDGEYRDGVDMSPEEFYDKLEATRQIPSTAQPEPAAFLEVFRRALDRGESVVAVLLSSGISGTVQSAHVAKGICGGGDIHIMDSENATIALQALVLRAVALRDEGLDAETLVERLQEDKNKLRIRAMVDTLEYLRRGGRLSAVAAYAGTILGIKPLFSMKNGVLQALGKARGAPRAIAQIWEIVQADGRLDFLKPVCVGYSRDKALLERFLEYAKPFLKGHIPRISMLGSVMGAHGGPGMVGVAYFIE